MVCVGRVAAASGRISTARMPVRRGLLPLANVPNRERRHGGPERVTRREDAVDDAGVEMHVVVERRAEAVQEGDGAESRAGGGGRVHACGSAEQSPGLGKKELREGGDGAGRSARTTPYGSR